MSYISEIWERAYLTNNGPLVRELEEKIAGYLQLKHLIFTSNGTVSLQIALNDFGTENAEIITTPFSYVATTSSIAWEKCTPVFVDIDPGTFNIDPSKIENAITSKTRAILATHVFGNPCDIEEIGKIAQKNGLTVIYDAAHAFGTDYIGKSVLDYGDVTSVSFHATKLFHTIEGGALICHSDETAQKFRLKRNFGHNGFDVYTGVGINGKNSEFHAAMGLSILPDITKILADRKRIFTLYHSMLAETVRFQQIDPKTTSFNCAYVPVVFASETDLLEVKLALEKNDIHPRRYFYPSLNTLHYAGSFSCPVSEDLAGKILCLPCYFGLEDEVIITICKIITEIIHAD